MTYIVTAQKMAELIANAKNYNAVKLAALMQSLPMVDRGALTDTYIQTVPDKCDRIVWRNHYYHLPLKVTSPQALTPITADDVTDETVAIVLEQEQTGCFSDYKSMIVAAYNAVIKHRGEAK